MHPAQFNILKSQEVHLLTIAEACRRLQQSRSAFYAHNFWLIRKVGKASRVRSDELEAYIANLPHSREVR